MKNTLLVLAALASLNASAHMIKGNPILRGSIKTKVLVESVQTTCKVKIEKPKNHLVEDSYGNPAYKVATEVNLTGSDSKREIKIDFTKQISFTNLWQVGEKTEVRDLEYAALDGSLMKIDDAGRLKEFSFLYKEKRITCSF